MTGEDSSAYFREMSGLIRTRSNWERYYSTMGRTPRKLKETAQFVVDALPAMKRHKVKRVLDLGCGVGRHCIFFARSGFDVIGIDTSKNALKMAKEWVQKENLENVSFVLATMTNLPLSDCCLDVVISVSVIHHALKKDIVASVNEIYRILGKNGLFLVNLASIKDPRYGTGRKVEENTFLILEAFEEKRFEELHHFFARREVFGLLTRFAEKDVKALNDKPNYWEIVATK